MPKLVCPILILNIVSSILCPVGKVIWMVRLRTSFIRSWQFWEIGNPHLEEESSTSV